MIIAAIAIAAGIVLALVIWSLLTPDNGFMRQLEDPSARLLPSQDVVNAMFNEDDRDFIVRQNSPELLAILEAQRRTSAKLWLTGIRFEASEALREYRTTIRKTSSVSFTEELRVLSHAFRFFALHSLVSVLVRCTSVFRVRNLLKQLYGLSEPIMHLGPVTSASFS